jgi:hypothetical protein
LELNSELSLTKTKKAKVRIMKNKNLIVISLLATFLLSATFVSFVAADESVPDATSSPDRTPADYSDNSTVTSDKGILYTIQDNRTATNDTQVPAEANLIATQIGVGSDNTYLTLAVGVVLAAGIGGAVGVYYYRKQAAS